MFDLALVSFVAVGAVHEVDPLHLPNSKLKVGPSESAHLDAGETRDLDQSPSKVCDDGKEPFSCQGTAVLIRTRSEVGSSNSAASASMTWVDHGKAMSFRRNDLHPLTRLATTEGSAYAGAAPLFSSFD